MGKISLNAPAECNERVRSLLSKEIAASKYPGMQYLVVDAKERLFEYYGGVADVEKSIPITPSTTMMAYSMTKTFTAAAVLQLIERGKVSLDQSVVHYLPSFPYGSTVTVHHLLSQTSGLPDPIPLRWVHPVSQDPSFDESSALQAILAANPKLAFPPGSRYGYSNISYWFLGQIIAQTSGESYKDYMEHHILAPLGLSRTDAAFSIVNGTSHAKGYIDKPFLMTLSLLVDKNLIGNTEGKWVQIKDHYLNGPAFGGLIATGRAVSVFLQDQLRDRSVLFSPETHKLFFTQQTSTSNTPVAMTLGWHIGELVGKRYFSKEGGGGGYHSEMRIYSETGFASVIMVNETSDSSIRTLDSADIEFLNESA